MGQCGLSKGRGRLCCGRLASDLPNCPVCYSVIYGIMNRRRLENLRRKVEACRRAQPKAEALQALAKALGRKKANRGKEPTFVNTAFPMLRPLSIPKHKGRDLPTGTKNSILDQMDEDLIAWDERLAEQERADDNRDKNG